MKYILVSIAALLSVVSGKPVQHASRDTETLAAGSAKANTTETISFEVLEAISTGLAIAKSLNITRNDLVADAGNVTAQNSMGGGSNCAPMTVIFARGTTEPGNIGVLVGPPFIDAITGMIGANKVTVQGVNYPADIAGFLAGGDAKGSATMAQLVTQAVSSCPNSKIVMSGYSQGGQLVHKAAAQLPAKTMAAVNSVVIFGDPDNGTPVQGASAANTLVICHVGDDICLHGDAVLPPHLTYAKNATIAAMFVVAKAGLGMGNPN